MTIYVFHVFWLVVTYVDPKTSGVLSPMWPLRELDEVSCISDDNQRFLLKEDDINGRWEMHFKELLNAKDVEEADHESELKKKGDYERQNIWIKSK